MIEILLEAERALTLGMIDQAERMYRQAADADPRNSIAVVGLARVALERGDEPAAWRFAKAALAIDGENVAASRLADRLEEVWAYRGESLAEVALAGVDVAAGTAAAGRVDPAAVPDLASEPASVPDLASEPEPASVPERAPPTPRDPAPTARPHAGVMDRLLRRNRP
jgi:hypothetical protein